MARAGLGQGWSCLFANDFDHKKAESYVRNWGDQNLIIDDIRNVKLENLTSMPNLAWASFPCQDLSLAGSGAGLKGERSGTFWPFWDIIKALASKNRAPDSIVLENVVGTLTSHKGKDFAAICTALISKNYRIGALVVDAKLFVPQSRPRLFIIAIKRSIPLPESLVSSAPDSAWHTSALIEAHSRLDEICKREWVWWRLKKPKRRALTLQKIIEKNPADVQWHSREETIALISKMSSVNLEKIKNAQLSKKELVGTAYRRTRFDAEGEKIQRVEVRFDGIAGCLRTPAGGSSRQIVFFVKNGLVRSRLMSARETARLMGLSDAYELPKSYNEAYHLTGDGVAVPVVSFLSSEILVPVLNSLQGRSEAA